MDDAIKSTADGGDNAWDSKSYLNIWIGNLQTSLGYASTPGSEASKDGVVLSYNAFGTINSLAPYNLGRTAVHEIGHWLGLKHIWGDTYCGDDGVSDTPAQSNYTAGCPNTFRSSCGNNILGDMYMNYMDFTNDACMNMFTTGQKDRMKSLFLQGGPRQSLLASKGLNEPWMTEAPLPENLAKEARVYPNPATTETFVNFGTDESWIGKKIAIVNLQGSILQTMMVNSLNQKLTLSSLTPGMYFIKGENGSKKLMEKLVKL
jgi:hypothetical protein